MTCACAYLVCGKIQYPQACPGVADLYPLVASSSLLAFYLPSHPLCVLTNLLILATVIWLLSSFKWIHLYLLSHWWFFCLVFMFLIEFKATASLLYLHVSLFIYMGCIKILCFVYLYIFVVCSASGVDPHTA